VRKISLEEFLDAPLAAPATPGSFDYAGVREANAACAQDDWVL